DNFLVRVDPDSMKCTIVLSDLGLAQIQDSISSSTTSKSFVDISKSEDTEAKHKHKSKSKPKPKPSICGTLVYNSCEALKGIQSQESDAYSLGLTLFAVFEGQDPFLQMAVLQGIDKIEFVTQLSRLIRADMGPKLCESRLFKTLKTIEGGKFKPVYSCLNEIFEGLTKVDIDERMSVHEACEKVQSIKPLLPKIGEGWECPSIDDIVKAQLAKHKGDSGCIVEEDASIQSVVLKPNWDDGLSLSRPSESKTPSTSSSTSSSASKEEKEEEEKGKEEEDLRKEVEALKQKLKIEEEKRKIEEEKRKREELKTARLMRKIDHRVIFDLVDKIKKSPDSASTSKLYHEHRDEILSVFLTFQSKSEIEEHKREIVLCIQCLRWFVKHIISENKIYLPIPDLNDLIDTFIDHLSRCEEVLEGDVDEEYCRICVNYTFNVEDKKDSFLPKISPTFQRILERGSKEKLGGKVVPNLLNTLRNISISPSSSTRSSILTLIKPYIRAWLRIYNDSEYYGYWMYILSFITLSSDNSTPNKSLCSEAWSIFHPVLDVVKREFVGDDHEHVLCFFSDLCCDPSHAVEVYDNVKDLLDGWFTVIKRKHHEWGIKYWSRLISMFSTVPSIVPYISPKYDANMEWCKNNGAIWSSVLYRLILPKAQEILKNTAQVGVCVPNGQYHVLNAVHLAKQHCKHTGEPLSIALLDFRNAFNSISVVSILHALDKLKVSDHVKRNVCRYFSTMNVVCDDDVLDRETGLVQGDKLPSLLFSLAIIPILALLEELMPPIEMKDASGTFVAVIPRVIAYLDDITLIVRSIDELRSILSAIKGILPEFGLELNRDKTIYVPLAQGSLPVTTEEDDFVVERCHDVMGVPLSSDEEIASQAAVDSLKQTLEVAVTTSEFLDLQPFHYVFETVILKQFYYLIQYSSIPDDELITMNTALSNLWSNKLKIEIPSTRLALPLEKGGLRCHMPLYDRDTLKLRSLKHLARDVRGVFPSGIGAFLKNLQASNPSKHFMDLLHTAAWVEFHLSDPGFGATSQEMEHDETRDENKDEVQSPASFTVVLFFRVIRI
ncbi:hypothetical protein ADUPG1_012142, partial [Aduncisulcus paluster]